MPLVALISGEGTNLQAIIEAISSGRTPARIEAVISNRSDAAGLDRARRAGLDTRVLAAADFSTRESYDSALARLIEGFSPRLIVLAGFMRLLSPQFVARFEGRILNIHPSLLPRYRGLGTHAQALEAGEKVHGASVHFVTEGMDEGPVVLQARVPVLDGDDPKTLARRVLAQEHVIYPRVIDWFVRGRLTMKDGHAWLDGRKLDQPITMTTDRGQST